MDAGRIAQSQRMCSLDTCGLREHTRHAATPASIECTLHRHGYHIMIYMLQVLLCATLLQIAMEL